MRLLSVRMHERYMYPGLLLLLLAYVYKPSRLTYLCYGGFSEHTGLAGILESVPMPENGFAACLSVELPGEKAQENLPCQHSSGDQKDDGGAP